MDSARFIRRKSVLALWIITPLALMAGMTVASRTVLEREKRQLERDRDLAGLIPDMEACLNDHENFAAAYSLETATRSTFEDRHLTLLNKAASGCDFIITAVNLTQDEAAKIPPGTARITLSVKGTGSAGGIASFLNNIKTLDSLIYESMINIQAVRSTPGQMGLEAEFGRVYLSQENIHEVTEQN